MGRSIPAGTAGSKASSRKRVHAVVFDGPDPALDAVRSLVGAGYDVVDVHSPFPIHGVEEAMGMEPTRLPWATFVGGAVGGGCAILLQWWTHALDWPLNIGGKTDAAWPAQVPVAFELTVLIAAFFTVGGLFVRSRLTPSTSDRIPDEQPHPGVTNDRFVVLVSEGDAGFSRSHFIDLCDGLAPADLVEGWRIG